MKTAIQITQLVYDLNRVTWELHLHIRGCTTKVKITANEAQSILQSIKQDISETDRYGIEVDKEKGVVYYIIN